MNDMKTAGTMTIETLVNAVSEAFETMAFMVACPPGEELPIPPVSIMAHMDFTGPVSGRAELLAGRDLVRQLAANMMGIDPGDPLADEKSIDAFKEMLNTTLGVMLPTLARTPADVFDVSIPQANLIRTTDGWHTFITQSGVVTVEIDGHPLAIHLVESL